MARNLKPWSESPVIELDIIDSTNNYAMQLIDADSAQPGTVVVSRTQIAGKGQRGKSWIDQPRSSLLFSLIADPRFPLSAPMAFSASVALGITDFLLDQDLDWNIRIKWPNDILINDKKAGGILIENVIKGKTWTGSVVGLGLNVGPLTPEPGLSFATSLAEEGGYNGDPWALIQPIRAAMERRLCFPAPTEEIKEAYHGLLYRMGQEQRFRDSTGTWSAKVMGVNDLGQIGLQKQGKTDWYTHGSLEWVMGNG